jgi:hypothetical protein
MKNKITQPYIYKWTQISTGMMYLGSKTKAGWNPSRHMEYICSSKVVKPLVLANPDDWKCEILMVGDHDGCQYIFNKESEMLQEINARDNPEYYNQHNNDGIFSRAGTHHTEETKKKYMELVKSGKHNLVGNTNPSYSRVSAGTHHLLGNNLPRVSGKKHYLYNHTVHSWKNKITGNTTQMTHAELVKTYDLDHGHVGRLIRNERKSHKGWALLQECSLST